MACSGCDKDKDKDKTNNQTACECPNPGFCKRHDMEKGPHLHRLCQTRLDYFVMWEEGHGPGQGMAQRARQNKPQTLEEIKEEVEKREKEAVQSPTPTISENTNTDAAPENESPRDQKMPSLARQAWNFTRAVADHIKSGAAHASEKLYKHRLQECDGCDRREDTRCLECGCFIPTKAKWASGDCPIGKWTKEEDLQ